ncbi:MAG: hypothetical protein KatS3mg032_0587 [Cyclobacteriaceae bacterium]|nr:MAG: hypothetical protein KatS3mg032_0587 [Cyclobacteriaceae bacterium]
MLLPAVTPAQQARPVLAHILNLQFAEARTLARALNPPRSHYYESLADMLELFVSEDPALFEAFKNRWESRLDELGKTPAATSEKMYVLAELRLQWAFVNLKFGHELQGAWHIRQSYLAAQSCRQKYPHYEPIRKTWGTLNILLGSVPEKYQWVLRMLNLRGSVESGLHELLRSSRAADTYGTEARIIMALAQSFLLEQHEAALAHLQETTQTSPGRLMWFLTSAIALKGGQAEKALVFLDSLLQPGVPCPISYAYYLRGETLLAAERYEEAAFAYRQFLEYYRGENFVKDAWFKAGICQALMNNRQQAEACFAKAQTQGSTLTEADRYAQTRLNDSPWPHPVIARIRYATDGGYYNRALELARQHARDSFPSKKDSVEFLYRAARLYHRINQTDTCLALYRITIEKAGQSPWYFAPNACLQAGFLLQQRRKYAEAEKFFKKALTYPSHPYKNSIDSKAKSALERLKK